MYDGLRAGAQKKACARTATARTGCAGQQARGRFELV